MNMQQTVIGLDTVTGGQNIITPAGNPVRCYCDQNLMDENITDTPNDIDPND
jgi:hypothetical protein